MKKIFPIILILCISIILCFSGCKKEEEATAAGGTATPSNMAPMPGASPSSPGGYPSAGMPGPGMSGPGMPGTPSGYSPMGMPGMPGGMGGANVSQAPAPAPVDNTPIKGEEFPEDAVITKDDNREIRSYVADSARSNRVSKSPFGLSEMDCRAKAIAFVRKNYYYFDSMSFSYRNEPGKWKGNRWEYTWYQIIRDTKRTGNYINISVNPENGEIISYKSVRKNWTD